MYKFTWTSRELHRATFFIVSCFRFAFRVHDTIKISEASYDFILTKKKLVLNSVCSSSWVGSSQSELARLLARVTARVKIFKRPDPGRPNAILARYLINESKFKICTKTFSIFFFWKIVWRHQFELITIVIAITYSNMSRRSWLCSWYSKIEDFNNQKSGLTRVYSSPARSKPI